MDQARLSLSTFAFLAQQVVDGFVDDFAG